jgi:hypothetical protein
MWATVKGVNLNDYRGQEALLREAHGLLSALEGPFTEWHKEEFALSDFNLGCPARGGWPRGSGSFAACRAALPPRFWCERRP